MKALKIIILALVLMQTTNCFTQESKSKMFLSFSDNPLMYFEDIDFLETELGFIASTIDEYESSSSVKNDTRNRLVLQKDGILLEYRKYGKYHIVRADVTYPADFIPWSTLIGKSKKDIIQILGKENSEDNYNHSCLYFINFLYTVVIYYENDIVAKIRVSENL